MKAKQFEKKLALNKKTIACLETSEMAYVNGGTGVPISDMPTCVVICTETCSCVLSVCDTCM